MAQDTTHGIKVEVRGVDRGAIGKANNKPISLTMKNSVDEPYEVIIPSLSEGNYNAILQILDMARRGKDIAALEGPAFDNMAQIIAANF
jgi:hypothetical protein